MIDDLVPDMFEDTPLLIDDLYQSTFGKNPAFKSNKIMRTALGEARRFVLDPAMSSFLADIAFAVCIKRSKGVSFQSMQHTRRAARLPHHVTWIEYDVRAYGRRSSPSSTPEIKAAISVGAGAHRGTAVNGQRTPPKIRGEIQGLWVPDAMCRCDDDALCTAKIMLALDHEAATVTDSQDNVLQFHIRLQLSELFQFFLGKELQRIGVMLRSCVYAAAWPQPEPLAARGVRARQ